MLPKTNDVLIQGFTFEELPTRTFALRIEADHFFGYADGLAAMKQAVYFMLSIERYEYVIYSWNYGIELQDLFGRPIPFVMSELKRRIREALMQDGRITEVGGFDIQAQGNRVRCAFTVRTVFGDLQADKEVSV